MSDETQKQALSQRLRFSKDVRIGLKSMLMTEFERQKHKALSSHPNKRACKSYADSFIDVIQGQADWLYKQKWTFEHQKTQERDRTVERIGKALQRIVDDYLKLDTDVKTHVFNECILSLYKFYGIENQSRNPVDTECLIYENEIWILSEFKVIAKTIQDTVYRMPPAAYKKLMLSVAEGVLIAFTNNGIKYSKSQTGLATSCFSAILDLAEVESST